MATCALVVGCAHDMSGSSVSEPSHPSNVDTGYADGSPAPAEAEEVYAMQVSTSRGAARRARGETYAANTRAQGAPPSAARGAPAAAPEPMTANTPEVASDAVDSHGPMLVYTGTFHLAVYEIARTQEALWEIVRAAGGFVASSSDVTLVLRVPANKFEETVAQIEQAGQVEHREVHAEDVGEEFRDVAIRIRNLEAMRARIEAMLSAANTVADLLAIEQELRRITDELERLKGRERYLAHRVSFSTITVQFRRRSADGVEQDDLPTLPFPWLEQLAFATSCRDEEFRHANTRSSPRSLSRAAHVIDGLRRRARRRADPFDVTRSPSKALVARTTTTARSRL